MRKARISTLHRQYVKPAAPAVFVRLHGDPETIVRPMMDLDVIRDVRTLDLAAMSPDPCGASWRGEELAAWTSVVGTRLLLPENDGVDYDYQAYRGRERDNV